VQSVLGAQTPAYSLAIWHGFNTPLLMSAIALVGGAGLYALFGHYIQTMEAAPIIGRYVGKRNFETVLAITINGARILREWMRTEKQQAQLRLLLLTAFLAVALAFLRSGLTPGAIAGTRIDPAFALLWITGAAGAIGAAVYAKFHRLAALIMLGVAGLATCITFIWFAAPDLGLTQLLVEIITLVLLLLGLRWLPKRRPDLYPAAQGLRVWSRRALDLLIALVGGAGAAALSYAMMTRPAPEGLASYFLKHAYVDGGGMNVVNVILVDFRALDTLGEITVLAIAALTVFTLLRRFRPAADSFRTDRPHVPEPGTPDDSLYVPRVTMVWMFPVILTLALFLLVRGHDLPGGGFAAGVMAAIALLLLYMADGTRAVEARLHVLPLRWISVGLLCAAGTGVGAWLFAQPFLTSYFNYLSVPVLGDVPVASALLFDVGVFILVIGITTLILLTLAHQSLRIPHRRVPPAAPAADEEGG